MSSELAIFARHVGKTFRIARSQPRATTLGELIEEDLLAERMAIEGYTEILRFLEDRDPTTRRLIEEILAREEEHASDMARLLERVEWSRKSRSVA